MIPHIVIEDYNYSLPDERIAKYPLQQRDASKLLCYRNGNPVQYSFTDLPALLPEDSVMVFNDTKVVPARLHFQRASGAHIEIFCLEPVEPQEYATMFTVTGSCRWKCIVGNVKRWKNDTLNLYNPENDSRIADMNLTADLVERCGETSVVEFRWNNDMPFSKVLETGGSVPIPPYLNRKTEESDMNTYQTVYSKVKGSVAAPTAGLHFTNELLNEIERVGAKVVKVTLHVGAGTWMPVKTENLNDDEKEIVIAKIEDITANMEKEANIEALLKAKGFTEAVAVIGQDGINIIVKSDGLTTANTLQIQDIVTEESGFDLSKIKIIPVK